MFGYFAQPVLVGDEIVAVLDLKTDRERGKLLIQKWTWLRKDGRGALRKTDREANCTASSASSSRDNAQLYASIQFSMLSPVSAG